jgi:hypothetical protein
LPYSNWEWAITCRSESALSLKNGLQASLWALGGVLRFGLAPLRGMDDRRFQGRIPTLLADGWQKSQALKLQLQDGSRDAALFVTDLDPV